MNTILIAHNYTNDSFAAMSYYLAHYLAKEGNRVIFVSHKPHFDSEKIIKEKKGEIIVLSWPTKKRPTSIHDLFWFTKLFLRYKPKTVIGHFVGSNISAITAKILSFGSSNTIVYYHTLSKQNRMDAKNSVIKQKFLNYRKRLFYVLFCDLIVCPSRMSEQDLHDIFKIKKSKIVLNSIPDRFNKKTDIVNYKIIISYLGRLDPSKGVVKLIDAFKIHKISYPNSKLLLQIAGSGKLDNILKENANETNDIVFFGSLNYNQIDDYLRNSHFTVIPSLFDNLPTVGLESLMNATPLLISNNTGLTEYLTEGENCFKFDIHTNSLVELFNKIELYESNIINMRIKARESYMDLFSIKKYCENFSKIIHQL